MPVALTLKKIGGRPGEVYYPLQVKVVPKPSPGPREILVRLNAAALNHRDLFIRRHLYPGISFDHPLLADGQGTVVRSGPDCSRGLQGKDVILFPARGWEADPDGPEDVRRYSVIGGTAMYDAGTAQEYIVCSEEDVELAPEHLSAVEGAALPLAGLTGWRALVTKTGENASRGRNILITGIGGGVALQVLQFAVALGCNVWVTSGDKAKIERAVRMGARGGVLYRDEDWGQQLSDALPRDRPFVDAVVDGAGGDIVARATKLLRPGGIISQYGMTVAPTMSWSMQAVLKNVELKGSTMGSRDEFRAMVAFVRERPLLKPVISRVAKGLENIAGIDGLFTDMKIGTQFGKLVIDFAPGGAPGSKL